jgi:hypothetical protein
MFTISPSIGPLEVSIVTGHVTSTLANWRFSFPTGSSSFAEGKLVRFAHIWHNGRLERGYRGNRAIDVRLNLAFPFLLQILA